MTGRGPAAVRSTLEAAVPDLSAQEPLVLAPSLVAGLTVGLSLWLVLPRVPRMVGWRSRPLWGHRRRLLGWAALPVVLLGVSGLAARWAVLAAIGSLAAATGVALVGRARRRTAALAVSARVRECCETVAAELASGLPPGEALSRAASVWPPLAPVAEAVSLGGDLPRAWREAARTPGAGELRLVGAAWEVAHRTGAGLSAAMTRVAAELRRGDATRRVVAAELASARATARLIAALPVFALAMGSGVGGNPWGFLLGQPLGLACLAAGLALGLAGLWWIEVISDGVLDGAWAGS